MTLIRRARARHGAAANVNVKVIKNKQPFYVDEVSHNVHYLVLGSKDGDDEIEEGEEVQEDEEEHTTINTKEEEPVHVHVPALKKGAAVVLDDVMAVMVADFSFLLFF